MQEKKAYRFKLGKPITASPVVVDINGDGVQELLIVADKLYAFEISSFNLLVGFPVTPGAPAASTPYLFTGKNGEQSIYFGSDDNCLYGISSHGKPKMNFPVHTGGDVFTSPFSADVDNDGYEELIFGSDDRRIYSVKLDHKGNNQQSIRHYETKGFVSSSPALFPIPDGTADIIVCSWDEHIYRLNGTTLSPVWIKPAGHVIWSSPLVSDIDNDGSNEIIFTNNQLHVLDGNGNPIAPFPLRLGSWTVASPALCDLNTDGALEIISCADSVYVNSIDGTSLPGFPFKLKSPVWASPITVDIDGDGKEEIIICDYDGNMFAISPGGNILDAYSRSLGDIIVSTPLAFDIDNDGLLEIIICTFDGWIWIIPTYGKISSWRTFRGSHIGGMVAMPVIRNRTIGQQNKRETFNGETNKLTPPLKSVNTWRVNRRNCGSAVFYELSITIHPQKSLKKGMMYFLKHNTWDPSPLFGDGKRFTARFPPYRRFSRVYWYVELTDWHENIVRIPETGYKSFRVW